MVINKKKTVFLIINMLKEIGIKIEKQEIYSVPEVNQIRSILTATEGTDEEIQTSKAQTTDFIQNKKF